MIRTWHNPDTSDGYWPVDAVLQLRGPPEARYVQVDFSPPNPDLDLDTEHFEFTDLQDADGRPRSGDGSSPNKWASDEEPGIEHNFKQK
jgi:hypothetical protein